MDISSVSENLARLISNVSLAQQPIHSPARNNEAEQEDRICDSIQDLSLSASELATEVQQAHDIHEDGNTHFSRRLAAIGLVLKRSAEIARTAHVLEDSAVKCLVSRLMSIHDAQHLRKLLLHFESELERIVKKGYKDAEWGQASLMKILEACHIEASTGSLHVDNYFAPLYEAACESPYDPDFESEACYDHESRLQVDEGYAEAESLRRQRRRDERKKNEMQTHRAWIEFWVQRLHICPDGPTLFWPYPVDNAVEELPVVPRYLFRAFDASSSGLSDEDVVASSASMYIKAKGSRCDLLSLKLEDRAEKLVAHLKKPCFGDNNPTDDLMSWSSSMLFVLQYAIWRCNISKGRRSPADTYICVVDTAKFPRGQFARDTWLLQQCRGNQNEQPDVEDVIRLRQAYDNGECLSQGLLVHRDRSAVTTLEDLIQAGLHKLYPELDDPNGTQRWTNRVRDLRSAWAQPRSTSYRELESASRIATTCFAGLPAREMAICLLTLKNRELKTGSSTGTLSPIER